VPVALNGQRAVFVGARSYPIVLPSVRDPRLHLAAVITALHVLGQTTLDFELSIAQILVALGTSAVIEFVVLFATRHVIAWPASALLAGNGVAFLLRVEGTEHGQWWSLRGAPIFMATAALAVLSKYLVRWQGRPLFNPSNIGLVVCFLVLGSDRVNPLDLWWAPLSPSMIAVYAIIAIGGLAITVRVAMLPASLAFWLTFAGGSAILSASDHCFTARWHVGPVCGGSFWTTLAGSPEVLIFALFMITDPKTAPTGRAARLLYGALVGFVATVFLATQTTEFGVKVGVLGALVVVCALRPVLEALLPAAPPTAALPPRWQTTRRAVRGNVIGAIALSVTAGVVVLLAIPRPHGAREVAAEAFVLVDTARLGTDGAIDVPPITIAPVSRRLDLDLSDDTARTMARDLVIGLHHIETATLARDPKLAAPFLTSRGRDQLEQELAVMLDATPVASPAAYQFDRMTVVVMREGRNSQAVPKLAIRAEGVVAGSTETADRTYAMAEVNGRFLIDGQYDTASVVLD
jgi:Na+-translocating ferredoxin:NAD+ oxidoreductase RnfD subunit